MVMMGSECLQCGKPLFHDRIHLCNDFPTQGSAEQHAAQLQRDDPKEEFADAPFNPFDPTATIYPIRQPSPDVPGHAASTVQFPPGIKVNRIVTDIQLPCETCGEYVVYKPVQHKCETPE
jgi:hypothetical protein